MTSTCVSLCTTLEVCSIGSSVKLAPPTKDNGSCLLEASQRGAKPPQPPHPCSCSTITSSLNRGTPSPAIDPMRVGLWGSDSGCQIVKTPPEVRTHQAAKLFGVEKGACTRCCR